MAENVTLLAVILLAVINLKRHLVQLKMSNSFVLQPFGVIGSSTRISTFHFRHPSTQHHLLSKNMVDWSTCSQNQMKSIRIYPSS